MLQTFEGGAGRAQLIAASGTGKTLLSLWVTERMGAARAVYFAPSLALIRQTALAWAAHGNPAVRVEAICVCSDETVVDDIPRADVPVPVTTDPAEVAAFLARPLALDTRRVVFVTYQSVERVEEAFAAALGTYPEILPDLVLCDEAHRVAGPEGKRFQIVLDAGRIPGRHRLFLTATPRIVATEHAREDAYAFLASMDDVSLFGPVAYRLSFGEAIRLGLLADYVIAVLAVTDQEVRQLFSEPEEELVALAQAVATTRALERGMFRHALSFHHTRKAAARFADAVGRLATEDRHRGWCVETVFGDTPVSARAATVDRVLAAPRGLISNAKALAEGVDLPAVDAVVFVDPRRSVVEIAQAVGRALRRDPRRPDKVAHIAIPLIVEEGADPEKVLAGSAWEPVWRVVAALAAHDDRLERDLALAQRRLARADAAVGGSAGVDEAAAALERSLLLSLPSRIPLPRFRRSVALQALKAAGDPFEYGFERLLAHAEETGSAAVPVAHVAPDGFALGRWTASVRGAYRQGRLTEERIRRFETLP
ncbi:MAG TPA: Helicase associated domain protein, partial [Longimicrobium sp.]|nr:Helicase associated domain protein [Longimicrobium sp.]